MVERGTQRSNDDGRCRRRWVVLAVVLLAVFVDLADATIVNIALPHMQSSLGAGYAAAQWVMAGYSLTFALVLVTGGRLGDILGRKRMFLVGMAGFVLASIVCGAAPTAEVLIAGRLVQGVAAALMLPQAMSIIVVLFDPAERARAFVLYGITLSLANVSGPLLGALLTESNLLGLGWRTIFYVNVPLGVFAIILAVWLMPESRAAVSPRIDLFGMVLVSLAMFAVMFPLIQGRERGWDFWTLASLLGFAPVLALFVWQQRHRERRTGSALVPSSLFVHRSFVAGLGIMLVLFSGLGSLFLVLTYDLQLGQSWSLLRTAVAMASWPVGIVLTSPIARRYATSHGRRVIAIGLTVMVAGTLTLIGTIALIGPAATWWQIALPVLMAGLGMGMAVPILTGVVLGDIGQDDAGAASGIANAVMQLGTALGIAVVGTVFFSLADSAAGARAAAFSDAAATTLWYQVAVFTLALCLTPLLPRTAREELPPGDPPPGRPRTEEPPHESVRHGGHPLEPGGHSPRARHDHAASG